jgi:hypothetical protein
MKKFEHFKQFIALTDEIDMLYAPFVTLLSHFCHTAVTLLSHCCHTAVTLLLHCCYTVVTLLCVFEHFKHFIALTDEIDMLYVPIEHHVVNGS